MDIQTISIALAGIGVFIAAVNFIISSRHAHKQRQTEIQTRQAELFMQLYNRWISRDFAEIYARTKYEYQYHDLNDYWQKYSAQNNINAYVDHFMRGGFYEGIGVLVQQGLIDITLVDSLFRNHIIDYWEKVKPVIYGGRDQLQDTSQHPFYDSFEYLYNRLKNMKQRQQFSQET